MLQGRLPCWIAPPRYISAPCKQNSAGASPTIGEGADSRNLVLGLPDNDPTPKLGSQSGSLSTRFDTAWLPPKAYCYPLGSVEWHQLDVSCVIDLLGKCVFPAGKTLNEGRFSDRRSTAITNSIGTHTKSCLVLLTIGL